ncbi:hypothetical protein B0H13DRAFT_1936441 [Mycena leptocephala]|nr:hypothetical protein B0H13DRAFT_1936441 [Mycena leptocephala]
MLAKLVYHGRLPFACWDSEASALHGRDRRVSFHAIPRTASHGNNFSFIPPVSSISIIGIHPVPAHLSTKEFAANLEALADVFLARPIAQSNVLKWHMVVALNLTPVGYRYYRTTSKRVPIKAAGFPESQPVVVLQVECEVQYALSMYVHALNRHSSSPDPRTLHAVPQRRSGVQVILHCPGIYGYQGRGGISYSRTDMVIDIDTPASEGDIIRMNIYRCPPNPIHNRVLQMNARIPTRVWSASRCAETHAEIYTGLLSSYTIPRLTSVVQWEQDSGLAENLQVMGMSAVKPVVVTAGKVASLDDVKEALESNTAVKTVTEDPGMHTQTSDDSDPYAADARALTEAQRVLSVAHSTPQIPMISVEMVENQANAHRAEISALKNHLRRNASA